MSDAIRVKLFTFYVNAINAFRHLCNVRSIIALFTTSTAIKHDRVHVSLCFVARLITPLAYPVSGVSQT